MEVTAQERKRRAKETLEGRENGVFPSCAPFFLEPITSKRLLLRFYPGTLVFSSLQKPTFPNFDSISGIATSKTLVSYLFIKDLFYCIIQSTPRRKPLPDIRKVNISPCHVM